MDFNAYFNRVYEDYDKFALIPVVLWLGAAAILGYGYVSSSGDMLEKGVEFTGGTEIRAPIGSEVSITDVEAEFNSRGYEADATTGTTQDGQSLLLVTVKQKLEKSDALDILGSLEIQAEADSVTLNSVSSSISSEFFTQAMLAVVLAFTIMSLVIFGAFKDVTPSIAVILAAAGDIIISLAAMYVLSIPLTLGSVAALLMLIGYSVDTDIVLSTRVLKRNRGSLQERIWSSVKTGVTMSSGGIAGFTILYAASYLMIGASSTFTQIASVMVIGLLADIPLTWFGNAYILKKYVEGDWDIVDALPVVRRWS